MNKRGKRVKASHFEWDGNLWLFTLQSKEPNFYEVFSNCFLTTDDTDLWHRLPPAVVPILFDSRH